MSGTTQAEDEAGQRSGRASHCNQRHDPGGVACTKWVDVFRWQLTCRRHVPVRQRAQIRSAAVSNRVGAREFRTEKKNFR